MPALSYRVTGVKEIQRAYAVLPRAIAGKIVRQSMRKGTALVKAEVEKQAPRASGLLAKSVKVRAGKRKRGSIAFVIQIGAKAFKGETYYAAFKEYGTEKMPPDDFMKRAFDVSKEAAAALTVAEIKSRVNLEIGLLRFIV